MSAKINQQEVGSSSLQGGYRPSSSPVALLQVEPPREEDLQPSYAQILPSSNADKYGFYGSMSKSIIGLSRFKIPNCSSSRSKYLRIVHRILWRHTGLPRLSESIQTRVTGIWSVLFGRYFWSSMLTPSSSKLAWSQNLGDSTVQWTPALSELILCLSGLSR